jgi:excisionase family DNA binding protein
MMARPEVTGGKVGAGAEKFERLTYSVPEAGALIGLGRDTAYAAAARGDLPVIRIGRLLRVPKIALTKMLESVGQKTA